MNLSTMELRDMYAPALEGHHTVKVFEDKDYDHGPCTGYEVKELGLTVYLYENDPTRISFNVD